MIPTDAQIEAAHAAFDEARLRARKEPLTHPTTERDWLTAALIAYEAAGWSGNMDAAPRDGLIWAAPCDAHGEPKLISWEGKFWDFPWKSAEGMTYFPPNAFRAWRLPPPPPGDPSNG